MASATVIENLQKILSIPEVMRTRKHDEYIYYHINFLSFLHHLPFPKRLLFCRMLRLVTRQKDSHVFSNGTPCDGIYVLLRGEVRVSGKDALPRRSADFGEAFGDRELPDELPWTETVTVQKKEATFAFFSASDHTRLMGARSRFVLPDNAIRILQQTQTHRVQHDVVALGRLLQRMPFFEKFPEACIMEMARVAGCKIVDTGGVVYHEGDPASCLYVLTSGSVGVHVRSEPSQALPLLEKGVPCPAFEKEGEEKKSDSDAHRKDEMPLDPDRIDRGKRESAVSVAAGSAPHSRNRLSSDLHLDSPNKRMLKRFGSSGLQGGESALGTCVSVLADNECFGALDILQSVPRETSMYARQKCVLISLEKGDYIKVLTWMDHILHHKADLMAVLRSPPGSNRPAKAVQLACYLLQHLPFFKYLPVRARLGMCRHASYMRVPANSKVVEQSSTQASFYCVLEGVLEEKNTDTDEIRVVERGQVAGKLVDAPLGAPSETSSIDGDEDDYGSKIIITSRADTELITIDVPTYMDVLRETVGIVFEPLEFFSIMKKQPSERSSREIDVLEVTLRRLQFLQQLPVETRRALCLSMKYEHHPPGSLVVREGDRCDVSGNFYVIMDGFLIVSSRKEEEALRPHRKRLTSGLDSLLTASAPPATQAPKVIARSSGSRRKMPMLKIDASLEQPTDGEENKEYDSNNLSPRKDESPLSRSHGSNDRQLQHGARSLSVSFSSAASSPSKTLPRGAKGLPLQKKGQGGRSLVPAISHEEPLLSPPSKTDDDAGSTTTLLTPAIVTLIPPTQEPTSSMQHQLRRRSQMTRRKSALVGTSVFTQVVVDSMAHEDLEAAGLKRTPTASSTPAPSETFVANEMENLASLLDTYESDARKEQRKLLRPGRVLVPSLSVDVHSHPRSEEMLGLCPKPDARPTSAVELGDTVPSLPPKLDSSSRRASRRMKSTSDVSMTSTNFSDSRPTSPDSIYHAHRKQSIPMSLSQSMTLDDDCTPTSVLASSQALLQRHDSQFHVSTLIDAEDTYGPIVNSLSTGDSFGETALLTDTPRGATVMSIHPSQLVSISKEDYVRVLKNMKQVIYRPELCRRVLKKPPNERTADDITVLLRLLDSQFFRDLSAEVKEDLCRVMTLNAVNAREVVYAQGSVGSQLYIVLSGSVAVHKREMSPCGQRKRTSLPEEDDSMPPQVRRARAMPRGVVLNEDDVVPMLGAAGDVLYSGDCFGDETVVSLEPRPVSVVAREDTEVISIEKKMYHRILKRMDAFARPDRVKQILQKDRMSRTDDDNQILLRLVQTVTFIAALQPAFRQTLCPIMGYDRFPKGSVVFQEGERSSMFYIILSGNVALHKKAPERELPETSAFIASSIVAGGRGPSGGGGGERRPSGPGRSMSGSIATAALLQMATKRLNRRSVRPSSRPTSRRTSTALSGSSRRVSIIDVNLSAALSVLSQQNPSPLLDNRASVMPEMSTDFDDIEIKLMDGNVNPYGDCLATLTTGEGFGEVALVTNDRRTTTALAVTEVEVLTIRKRDYTRAMRAYQERELQETVKLILESFPFLRGWSKQELTSLCLLMKPQRFSRNSVITRQGKEADLVYILKSGECRVVRHEAEPPAKGQLSLNGGLKEGGGAVLEVALFGPSEIFGDVLDMKENYISKFSVIAAHDCTVLTIPPKHLASAMDKSMYAELVSETQMKWMRRWERVQHMTSIRTGRNRKAKRECRKEIEKQRAEDLRDEFRAQAAEHSRKKSPHRHVSPVRLLSPPRDLRIADQLWTQARNENKAVSDCEQPVLDHEKRRESVATIPNPGHLSDEESESLSSHPPNTQSTSESEDARDVDGSKSIAEILAKQLNSVSDGVFGAGSGCEASGKPDDPVSANETCVSEPNVSGAEGNNTLGISRDDPLAEGNDHQEGSPTHISAEPDPCHPQPPAIPPLRLESVETSLAEPSDLPAESRDSKADGERNKWSRGSLTSRPTPSAELASLDLRGSETSREHAEVGTGKAEILRRLFGSASRPGAVHRARTVGRTMPTVPPGKDPMYPQFSGSVQYTPPKLFFSQTGRKTRGCLSYVTSDFAQELAKGEKLPPGDLNGTGDDKFEQVVLPPIVPGSGWWPDGTGPLRSFTGSQGLSYIYTPYGSKLLHQTSMKTARAAPIHATPTPVGNIRDMPLLFHTDGHTCDHASLSVIPDAIHHTRERHRAARETASHHPDSGGYHPHSAGPDHTTRRRRRPEEARDAPVGPSSVPNSFTILSRMSSADSGRGEQNMDVSAISREQSVQFLEWAKAYFTIQESDEPLVDDPFATQRTSQPTTRLPSVFSH